MKNLTRDSLLNSLVMAVVLCAPNIGLTQLPSIVASPVSQAVPQGATASFSISVSGPLPITYTWLWFRNGLPPTLYYQATLDSTNCTIVITNVQLSDAGFFNIDTQNSYGPGPGQQAVLAVISPGIETNGFVLNVYGLTNSIWTVNCTTNLSPPEWFTLTNFSIPQTRKFKFVDREATNLNRFYQVIPIVY